MAGIIIRAVLFSSKAILLKHSAVRFRCICYVALPAQSQQLLNQFAEVFETPTALPPWRSCDHHIPFMEGARPVNIRPYRYSPKLETEIEKQVHEMLQLASQELLYPVQVLLHPSLWLGKRMDHGGCVLTVDYRHLKLLTLKAKFSLPVIDELFDELTGSSWFSKTWFAWR